MKPYPSHQNLHDSDLVRASRAPGFEWDLFSSVVRVTKSGWAGCWVKRFHLAPGKSEDYQEHRFSPEELVQISQALESVAQETQEALTGDDIGSRKLSFRLDGQTVSREILEFDFATATAYEGSEAFRTAWEWIHRPFAEILHRIPYQG